jgi:tRNA dimethylallyltransferase
MRLSKIKDKRLRIITVIGPTASGKSELAVQLAKRFNGEIISCDSRQIYKGMDIGTGKVAGHWAIPPSPLARGDVLSASERQRGRSYSNKIVYVYKSVPHHLIDFQNPSRQYSVARFQRDAKKIIADILKRGHLPILCGGTMHWVDAVVYNQPLPDVKPNLKLRARLEKQSADVLFKRLVNLDPARAASIDKFNKRRLIRALEIVITTGRPVPLLPWRGEMSRIHLSDREVDDGGYSALLIGTNLPQKTLYKKIDKRLKERLKHGMIQEVKNLHLGSPSPLARGDVLSASERQRGGKALSWKKLESFGLEYKFVSLFLQKKISEDELFTQLSFAIKHYAKRQMTWWKRNKEIIWIKPDIAKAAKLTKKFLEK